MAAVADFKNWRFAVTEVLVGDVPGATAAQLKVQREATFDEFFAFTATSTTARSYTNQSGVLKNDLAANAPRRDYRNGKQQFRLENARTNLCLRSEELDNATWAKTGATVPATNNTAPNGTSTADTLLESAGGTVHITRQTFTAASLTNSVAYTVSCYVKRLTGTRNFRLVWINNTSTATVDVKFDLDTLAITNTAGTGTITDVGNGWYRVTATWTAGTHLNNIFFDLYMLSGSSASYSGDGSSSLALWGIQLEAGAFVSDYIPTTSAAVTRAIETARLSPLLEAILQRAAASVVVRGDLTNTVSGDRLYMGGATTVALAKATSTSSQVTATNATTALNATLGSGTNAGPLGVALGYNASARALVGNGGTVATDANGPGALTTVYLARNATNTAATYGDGLYDFVGISPEKLANATLQALAVAA